jgi:hypothetical protein
MGRHLGFAAMDKSMTIQGVYFEGETQDLGQKLSNANFMDDFYKA